MIIEKVNPAGWKVTDNDGNVTYFGEYGKFGCYGNEGVVYKDEEAFEKGEGVCYIPEYSFENSDQNAGELFEFSAKEAVAESVVDNPYWAEEGYTRKALELLCEGTGVSADDLFEHLDWQSPETLLDEWLDDCE